MLRSRTRQALIVRDCGVAGRRCSSILKHYQVSKFEEKISILKKTSELFKKSDHLLYHSDFFLK